LGGGFPFPIVLVHRYKLFLCHTPFKPDLPGFPGIGVFECGLPDHVITRFASFFFYFIMLLFKNISSIKKKKKEKRKAKNNHSKRCLLVSAAEN
jgi:hypothetical protein